MSRLELPGFYRDNFSGRYFRDIPGERHFRMSKRLNQNVYINKPNSSLLDTIKNREIGQNSSNQVIKCYYKFKVHSTLKEGQYEVLPDIPIKDIEFVKGGKSTMFCLWSIATENVAYFLAKVKYRFSSPVSVESGYVTKKYILDMADETFLDRRILFFVNNNTHGQGFLNAWWFNDNAFETYHQSLVPMGPVHCVDTAYLSGSLSLAVGGDTGLILKLRDNFNYYVKYFAQNSGRTMTLNFNQTKNIIFSGQSNGSVNFWDLRAPGPAYITQLYFGSNTCIVDSLCLPSHNQFIVADADNKMCIFDMRIMKPSVHFFGHIHSLKKKPFSYENNLLCVTGGDNVVRIWHSSGGIPVYEIKPEKPENQQRAWLSRYGSKLNLYCFEGKSIRFFEL